MLSTQHCGLENQIVHIVDGHEPLLPADTSTYLHAGLAEEGTPALVWVQHECAANRLIMAVQPADWPALVRAAEEFFTVGSRCVDLQWREA